MKAAGLHPHPPADEGRGHESKQFTEADYNTNPPTSGAHFPQWAQDGVYEPDNTPDLGQLVHTLEHGRIDVQYKPGTDPELVKQLEAFVAENDGYHMLLFQNPTKMKPQVAATAWGQSLTCPARRRQDVGRAADLPRPLHRHGPRAGPVGQRRGRLPPAARLAAVEPVAGHGHARRRDEDAQVQPQRRVLDVPEVELDPLGPGQRGAAVDLRPARHARAGRRAAARWRSE